MRNYSVRISRDKSLEKLKEKDWDSIEQEAVEGIYSIIRKHIEGHIMSEEGSKTTVVEYSISADSPHTYRNKEDKQNITLNT